MSRINLRLIEYFHLTAEHLNMTKAAQELYITQSALSQSIKSLETMLGCRLFHRGRKLSLTPEGKSLHSYTRHIYNIMQDMNEEMIDLKTGEFGTVRIGGIESFLAYMLPELLIDFGSDYSKIRFKLFKDRSAVVSSAVCSGDIHFGFVSTRPVQGGLIVRKLYEIPVVLVSSLKYKGMKLPQILAELPLLLMNPGQFERLSRKTSALSSCSDVRVYYPIECVAVIRGLVSSGVGVGLLPSYSGGNDLYEIRAVPELSMPVYLIHKKNVFNRAARQFLSFLEKIPVIPESQNIEK